MVNDGLTDLQTLALVRSELRILARAHSLPDEAMNALLAAEGTFERMIIDAPVETAQDAAVKFRFAADLIGNQDGDVYRNEPRAVEAAYAGLVALRHADWQGQHGRLCPMYEVA